MREITVYTCTYEMILKETQALLEDIAVSRAVTVVISGLNDMVVVHWIVTNKSELRSINGILDSAEKVGREK